jgi:hypothetical protein
VWDVEIGQVLPLGQWLAAVFPGHEHQFRLGSHNALPTADRLFAAHHDAEPLNFGLIGTLTCHTMVRVSGADVQEFFAIWRDAGR